MPHNGLSQVALSLRQHLTQQGTGPFDFAGFELAVRAVEDVASRLSDTTSKPEAMRQAKARLATLQSEYPPVGNGSQTWETVGSVLRMLDRL